MKNFLLFCLLSFALVVFAHEGHHEINENLEDFYHKESAIREISNYLTRRIGSFHLVLLHFPIALINMTAVSEFLLAWYKKPIFDCSSRFMLVSVAILAPLTAFSGLIYSYSASYNGVTETYLRWHMWLGISTALFTLLALIIRERIGVSCFYFICFAILFIIVNLTGFLGGEMTYG